jgi:hypothetical protein
VAIRKYARIAVSRVKMAMNAMRYGILPSFRRRTTASVADGFARCQFSAIGVLHRGLIG